MWLLNDPWQLSDRQLIFPQALAQMLLFLDGTHNPQEIQRLLSAHLNSDVPFEIITDTLAQLDQSFLLQNERFDEQKQHHLDLYRTQPFRPPALAGLGYPVEPEELSAYLHSFETGTQDADYRAWHGRGIVSPHIDYQRGGPVYGQVWRNGATAVAGADLVLIFGTDHFGRAGSITLTHVPYATPFGTLPTDSGLVNLLAQAYGAEVAFQDELNHRKEHSIELSAVWLHYVYHKLGRSPAPMIPILVGSFHHLLENSSHPSQDTSYYRFLDTLREETRGRRVLVVGSVDLAHVGPAFGDMHPMDQQRRASLAHKDSELMSAIIEGSAADFYRRIWEVRNENKICGFAPLYLMLEFLQPTNGIKVAYQQCPADATDSSLVSICGLLLD